MSSAAVVIGALRVKNDLRLVPSDLLWLKSQRQSFVLLLESKLITTNKMSGYFENFILYIYQGTRKKGKMICKIVLIMSFNLE